MPRAAASALLLCAAAVRPPQPAGAACCAVRGDFNGSEDARLWRDGIAFQSSGLCPSTALAQGGLVLAVDLAGDAPSVRSMELRGMPAGFGFRPHGIHVDNATQRVYAVSHSDQLEEESIVVFDIVPAGRVPALAFRYALTSPRFEYHGENVSFFLNAVASVGPTELYTTQYGPQTGVTNKADKVLFRCTWDEADAGGDGRLPAACAVACPECPGSLGLNGLTVDVDGSRLWVNDLHKQRLWVFDRTPNGTLIRRSDVELPGTIDNVQRDFGSGDLTMGLISPKGRGTGGAIIDRGASGGAFVALEQDTGVKGHKGRGWQVSTSLQYRRWTLLGSPWDAGPIVCDTGAGSSCAIPPGTPPAPPPCVCGSDYPFCWDSGWGSDKHCYRNSTSYEASSSECPGNCTGSHN